ncbi:hypothetical protein MMC07_001919, partial [Pseudocyphellaria aurata]|nr:hypothetical protein [Pseudocyphellaria aurata]
MRFKASITNIGTFSKLTSSLSLLGKVVWIRLDDDQVRFTVIPEQGPGTQVWAVLSKDTIFEEYNIKSATPANTINLQVPLAPLQRALRSALSGSSASIRLTKQNDIPFLSLTIINNTFSSRVPLIATEEFAREPNNADDSLAEPGDFPADRQTTITQSIPVIVLPAASVSSIHEPRCRDPDVHIMLPPLLQLKSISDRFTKMALSTTTTPTSRRGGGGGGGGSQDLGLVPGSSSSSRLVLAANMHGALRIGVTTAALKIESRWEGLVNPELDPNEVEGGEEGVNRHASTLMKEKEGEEAWAV